MILDTVLHVISWTMIHFLWQGALIGAAVYLLTCIVNRCSANAPYTIAAVGMLLMACAAISTAVWEVRSCQLTQQASRVDSLQASNHLDVLREASQDKTSGPPKPTAGASDGSTIQTDRNLVDASVATSSDKYPASSALPVRWLKAEYAGAVVHHFQNWIASAWLLGFAFCSARLCFQWRTMKRCRASGRNLVSGSPWLVKFDSLAKRMRIKQRVRLLTSESVLIPMTMGVIRPVIIVPVAMLSNMSTDQVESILLHELAHVRRCDYLTNLLQATMETVFFFHPVVWWLSGTMREEREHICDQIASRACGDVVRYAEALTALEESRSGTSPLVIAADGSRPGSLLRRLERLLGAGEVKQTSGWLAPLAALLICGVSLGLFGLSTAAQSQPEPDIGKQTRGQVVLIRDIIERFDSVYARDVDVPDLLNKQHVALSPDGPWLALARGNSLFLIERDTGKSQAYGVFGGIKSIVWNGESVDVTRADDTNSALNVPLPVVKLRHFSGHPMSANALVKARVGFADTEPKWMAWGNKENTISLVGLEPGTHWLVPQPHLAVIHVEMPQGKWRRIPNYSMTRSQLHSNKVFAKASVRREDDMDVIVVTIQNNSDATFRLSEQTLDFDTEVDGHQYRVLSPQWTSDDALKFPITTIEQGEEQVIRLFWNDWVERGLWETGGVQFGLGPWPEKQDNGKVWVRVNGQGFGTLPVSLPRPESKTSDPEAVARRVASEQEKLASDYAESFECELIDKQTGDPVTGNDFAIEIRFLVDNSDGQTRSPVEEFLIGPNHSGQFRLTIPDTVIKHPDRDRIVVNWSILHPKLEEKGAREDVRVNALLLDDPKSARAALQRIELSPANLYPNERPDRYDEFTARVAFLRRRSHVYTPYNEIISSYESLLKQFPNHPDRALAMFNLASYFETTIPQQGVHPAPRLAQFWLRKAFEAAKPGSDIWTEAGFHLQGRIYFHAPNDAAKILDQILSTSPSPVDEARVWYNRQVMAVYRDDLDEAEKICRMLLDWRGSEKCPAEGKARRDFLSQTQSSAILMLSQWEQMDLTDDASDGKGHAKIERLSEDYPLEFIQEIQQRIESPSGSKLLDMVNRPPPLGINTLAALDYDLRAALQADPNYSSKGDTHRPQEKAIAAWRHFLQRDDIDQGQQIFAWWRIGSLTAYNFAPDKGEKSDPETAAQALSNVRELAGGRISRETLNAATVYGGIEGPPGVRADRLATAYRWLFTRTDAMVRESAARVNHNGYGIADEFMRGGMRLDTNAKKQHFLNSQLAEHREIFTRRITEEIRWSQSPDDIRKLLQSIKSVADQSQLTAWQELAKEVEAAEQSARAPAAAERMQKPANAEDQLATRRLFDQYINRVGKIPTDEIRAAIELVAARGRSDGAFRQLVLSEFEKRGRAKQPDQISRNLLAVITKWLTVEGGYRWNHELSPENPQQQVPMPNQAASLYLASPLLKQVIARGYQANRSDVPAYLFAARQAHHPQARTFLLDALNEPPSNGDLFRTDDADNAKSKWRDFPVGDDPKFIAAVGLAELGDSSGIEWLIASAAPNDFGDGNLFTVQHLSSPSGSLRENSRYALADLSRLPVDTDTGEWRDWWRQNKDRFTPALASLKTQILGGN